MSEMVERVARAMEPRIFEIFDRGMTVQNYFAERAFVNAEKVVKRTRKKARAAIAAMREPTEEMADAGFTVLHRHDILAEGEPSLKAHEVFRAMIDAALKE